MQRKLEYYRNLKPKGPVFKIKEMDPEQIIIQNAFKKNQEFLENHRKQRLADRNLEMDNTLQDFGEDPNKLSLDPEFVKYQEFRKQTNSKKIKNNLELLEQFNETSLRFVPLYTKRVQQKIGIDRMKK